MQAFRIKVTFFEKHAELILLSPRKALGPLAPEGHRDVPPRKSIGTVGPGRTPGRSAGTFGRDSSPEKHRDVPPEGHRGVRDVCANIRPADLTGLRDLSGLYVETAATRG